MFNPLYFAINCSRDPVSSTAFSMSLFLIPVVNGNRNVPNIWDNQVLLGNWTISNDFSPSPARSRAIASARLKPPS